MKRHPLNVLEESVEVVHAIEQDMVENGWRQGHPVHVWEDMLLMGGHRFTAAEATGVPIPPEEIIVHDFPSTPEGSATAAQLVLADETNRRDLAPGMRAAARLRMDKLLGSPPVDSGDRLRRLAKEARVSRGLMAQVDRVDRNDPELFEQVAAGTIEPKRAERIVRNRDSAKRLAARAKREAKVTSVPAPDIRLGRFQEVLADVRDVDLVLCDPPYPKEFLPLYSDLGEWAARALKPGHLLVAYSGHWHLGEVMARLGEHLDYHWMIALETPGASANNPATPFMPGWKPLVVFSNGPLSRHYVRATDDNPAARIYDYVRSDEAVAGDQHKWQQALRPAVYVIERLTEKGDLVADPFLGAGTTAVAAASLLRRFVGADVDPVAFETTLKRLRDARLL